MKTNTEQRILNIQAIVVNIMNTFNEDNELGRWIDLRDVDHTDLITDMVKALNFAYQELTGDYKTNIDFTYLCNQLIVQDLLEKGIKP